MLTQKEHVAKLLTVGEFIKKNMARLNPFLFMLHYAEVNGTVSRIVRFFLLTTYCWVSLKYASVLSFLNIMPYIDKPLYIFVGKELQAEVIPEFIQSPHL